MLDIDDNDDDKKPRDQGLATTTSTDGDIEASTRAASRASKRCASITTAAVSARTIPSPCVSVCMFLSWLAQLLTSLRSFLPSLAIAAWFTLGRLHTRSRTTSSSQAHTRAAVPASVSVQRIDQQSPAVVLVRSFARLRRQQQHSALAASPVPHSSRVTPPSLAHTHASTTRHQESAARRLARSWDV